MKKILFPTLFIVCATATFFIVVLAQENQRLKKKVVVLGQDNAQVRGEWVRQRLQIIAMENAFGDARVTSRGGGSGRVDYNGFSQTGDFQV